MLGADNLYETLRSLTGVRAERDIALSSLTSFQVGGPADVLAVVESGEGLQKLLRLLSKGETRWFVLGAGSNVIFSDAGFRGVVVKLGPQFAKLAREGTSVAAGCSALLSDLLDFCAREGLSGVEKLAGIPGTVGGAVRGNAGAFGVEMGNRVAWVRAMDARGQEKDIPASAIRFGYRSADFGGELGSSFVLVETGLSLEESESRTLREQMKSILARREAKQPLWVPSAGSVFKNPPSVKAAELIDKAGLKGRRVGGAQVSELHANFIVNRGGARTSDVLSLIDTVVEEVKKRFGVVLELEVKVIR